MTETETDRDKKERETTHYFSVYGALWEPSLRTPKGPKGGKESGHYFLVAGVGPWRVQ